MAASSPSMRERNSAPRAQHDVAFSPSCDAAARHGATHLERVTLGVPESAVIWRVGNASQSLRRLAAVTGQPAAGIVLSFSAPAFESWAGLGHSQASRQNSSPPTRKSRRARSHNGALSPPRMPPARLQQARSMRSRVPDSARFQQSVLCTRLLRECYEVPNNDVDLHRNSIPVGRSHRLRCKATCGDYRPACKLTNAGHRQPTVRQVL